MFPGAILLSFPSCRFSLPPHLRLARKARRMRCGKYVAWTGAAARYVASAVRGVLQTLTERLTLVRTLGQFLKRPTLSHALPSSALVATYGLRAKAADGMRHA